MLFCNKLIIILGGIILKVYERKSFPRTCRDLKKMKESGKLSFENAVQRSFVWKNTNKKNQMSMLIDSILRGFPIPPMYCNCIYSTPDDKVYDFVDGKQRVLTIIKFLNDEFALVNVPVYETEDGIVDLNGKKFSELPENFQDIVKTYNITVNYYENMEQDDIEEMFRRLNNGKSLTAIELTRANAKSKKQIGRIAKHPLFDLAFSEQSIAGYANEDVVIKSWIILYGDNLSLETRDVRPLIRSVEITDDQTECLMACFDRIYNICNSILSNNEKSSKKICKKILTKTHLISLVPIINQSIINNVDEDSMRNWLQTFFTTGKEATTSVLYNLNATTGSAKADSVKTRIAEITNSFNAYFENKESLY